MDREWFGWNCSLKDNGLVEMLKMRLIVRRRDNELRCSWWKMKKRGWEYLGRGLLEQYSWYGENDEVRCDSAKVKKRLKERIRISRKRFLEWYNWHLNAFLIKRKMRILCRLKPMFSEPDRSLNRKSYRFTVHWSNRWSNRGRTGDVINI